MLHSFVKVLWVVDGCRLMEVRNYERCIRSCEKPVENRRKTGFCSLVLDGRTVVVDRYGGGGARYTKMKNVKK